MNVRKQERRASSFPCLKATHIVSICHAAVMLRIVVHIAHRVMSGVVGGSDKGDGEEGPGR